MGSRPKAQPVQLFRFIFKGHFVSSEESMTSLALRQARLSLTTINPFLCCWWPHVAAVSHGTGWALCEAFPGLGRDLVTLQNVSTALSAALSQWHIVSGSPEWHGAACSGGTGVKGIKSAPKSFTCAF